jgi:hypothetical protein
VGKAVSTFAGHAELVGALGVATALRELQEVPGAWPTHMDRVSKTAGRARKKNSPLESVTLKEGRGKEGEVGLTGGQGPPF